jgi:hypothetical protein
MRFTGRDFDGLRALADGAHRKLEMADGAHRKLELIAI